MSITKRILFGVAASWFSRGVAVVLGMVLLPVLFRVLPRDELAIWMILTQSWAIFGILDFGFAVTITRRIAFAKAKSGSDLNAALSERSRAEIADLLTTAIRLYRLLAVLALFLGVGLGLHYLQPLETSDVSFQSIWIAWLVLCLSQSVMIWAAPWTCLLQGIGYIGWESIIASFINAIALLGQISAALLGWGLIGLAAVAAGGALLNRVVLLAFTQSRQRDVFSLRGHFQPGLLREMAPFAARAWVTALGTSLILYTDQFVIAGLDDTGELPAYRAAWVLVHNMTIVAVSLGTASGVFVSHLWQAEELEQLHRLLERNLRLGWLIMLSGAVVLIVAGRGIFDLWLGPGAFIGYPVLLAFLVSELLESQSYIISTASRATGDEAFAASSLMAGLLKLALSIFFANWLGLVGVALGTLLALALTNHWYMPWKGLSRLEYPFRRLLFGTALPLIVWLTIVLAGLEGVRRLGNWPPLSLPVHVAGVFVLALTIPAVWFLVIERDERQRLVRSLGVFSRLAGRC